MNFLKNWATICTIHFGSLNIFFNSLLTIFTLFFIKRINIFTYFNLEKTNFIFNDYLVSLITYLSMILIFLTVYNENFKKISILNKFKEILKSLWWLILCKMFLDITNNIIINYDFLVFSQLTIFPIILASIFSFLIFILCSYYFPKFIFKDNNSLYKFLLKGTIRLIFFIILSGISAFIIISFCAYLFSALVDNFMIFNGATEKSYLEELLNIILSVSFLHLSGTAILYNYYLFMAKNKSKK